MSENKRRKTAANLSNSIKEACEDVSKELDEFSEIKAERSRDHSHRRTLLMEKLKKQLESLQD